MRFLDHAHFQWLTAIENDGTSQYRPAGRRKTEFFNSLLGCLAAIGMQTKLPGNQRNVYCPFLSLLVNIVQRQKHGLVEDHEKVLVGCSILHAVLANSGIGPN